MKEYISKDRVIELINSHFRETVVNGSTAGCLSLVLAVEAEPSAEVKPIVRGEWEECDDWNDCNVYRCSNCEIEFVLEAGTPKENDYNFCPVCGADMQVGYTRNCEEFDTLLHEKRPIPSDIGERSEGK